MIEFLSICFWGRPSEMFGLGFLSELCLIILRDLGLSTGLKSRNSNSSASGMICSSLTLGRGFWRLPIDVLFSMLAILKLISIILQKSRLSNFNRTKNIKRLYFLFQSFLSSPYFMVCRIYLSSLKIELNFLPTSVFVEWTKYHKFDFVYVSIGNSNLISWIFKDFSANNVKYLKV